MKMLARICLMIVAWWVLAVFPPYGQILEGHEHCFDCKELSFMLTQGENWLRPGVFIHSSMLEHWGLLNPPPPRCFLTGTVFLWGRAFVYSYLFSF